MAGRTGADAIYKWVAHICGTLKRYSVKLDAFITVAQAADVITSTEAAAARAFLASANAACDIFNKLAGYNSIHP